MDCPNCGNPNSVHDTVFFVRKLLERYFALLASQKRMQAEGENREAEASGTPPDLNGIDLYNTDQIATSLQHGPIHDWFEAKNVQFRPNHKAVDTTGFFDEIAVEIGADYDMFKVVIDSIRQAQRIGRPGIYLNLSKRSQKDAQILTSFCRRLYDYAFVSKYFYKKEEKTIHMTLQNSPQVQRFFNGEWLEWFALMKVLEFCQKQRLTFSCARNVSVVFANEDLHELDVFFLINGNTPVCIECKTGEFRPSIDKYTTLRKRLGLQKSQFIICVLGFSDDQANGLSSMYDLTFVNERSLQDQLGRLL